MTREEAIELLQETKSCHLKAVCEALDMAIEALKARPTDGDLISRADAIEAVHTYFWTQLAESGGEWNDELQDYVFRFSKEDKRILSYNKGVSTALKALPSAEAVQAESTDAETVSVYAYAHLDDECEDLRNKNEQLRKEYDKLLEKVNQLSANRPTEEIRIVKAFDTEDRPKWIPCSERLPSDDEYVIVSVVDDHGDTPWSFTTVAWVCNGAWISDNEILAGNAVAWMPLPKPYKGGDTE